MGAFEDWLVQRGPVIARALDERREPICDAVSSRLAMSFPTLCFDASRPDAHAFQQRTFHETPRRFHRLLQVVLVLQTLEVITREYQWGWPVVSRYGVQPHHLLFQVRWYFEAAQAQTIQRPEDSARMAYLATTILRAIEEITSGRSPTHQNNGASKNGFHP
jgi:hypothetical protein